jgi:hypothetical protein
MTENTILQDRLPIPGFEGRYEIDRQGNVYAMFPFKNLKPGRISKTRVNPEGYVTTTLAKDGRGLVRTTHRLLMLTFCPVENSRQLEVNHIDLNKQNNRLDNLEWLTHHENIKHASRLKAWDKNQPRGEQTSWRKLNEVDVREIFRLHQSGMGNTAIAKQYGVSSTAILYIIIRKNWKHVQL